MTDEAMERYFESRARGRDEASARFKKDWNQRAKKTAEFLEFAGFGSADEIVAYVRASIDNQIDVENKLVDWFFELAKRMQKSSAGTIAMSVAAMFTANRTRINTKRISKEKAQTSTVRKARQTVPFFAYTPDYEILGLSETMRQFLDTHTLRDRLVLLASLTCGQPVSVIAKLTVGEVRKADLRIILQDDRSKTGEAYLTMMSAEVTKMIQNYVAKQRADASDSDRVFMARANKSLTSNHLAKSCRAIAEKLGLLVEGKNPYSPYAMRSAFRTALDSVEGIPDAVKKTMMGHQRSESEGYSADTIAAVARAYKKIEPLVTINGGSNGMTASDYEYHIHEQDKKIEDLEAKLEKMAEALSAIQEALK